MNKARRQKLQNIIDTLEEQRMQMNYVQYDEQEAYDNLPENIQDSDRGSDMNDNINDLESAVSDLEEIISNLQSIVDR